MELAESLIDLQNGDHNAAVKEQPAHFESAGRKKFALVVIATVQLMVMLDLTIVNIALPAIQKGLNFSSTDLSWVVDAYVLAFGGLLLLGGRSGDIFGRRKMLIAGISLFTLASMMGGFATTGALLIAARVIQGMGAAIASPTALSLIATIFREGHERHRAMAVYAAMSGAGGALGLLVGGTLVDIASWRWVLFVNVPIGIFLVTSAKFVLPKDKGTLRGKLDYLGAFLISSGLAVLVFGIERAPSNGWGSIATIAALLIALVLLVLFFVREYRIDYAIIPIKFLYHKSRLAGFAIMVFISAAMLSLLYFLTQFLQDVLHYSPIVAGVAYLPIPIVIGSVGFAVSKVVGKTGIKVFLKIGPGLLAAGLLLVSTVNATSHYYQIFAALVIVGVGMGFSFVPLTLNAVKGVVPKESGLASGLLNTSQQLGGSLGLAVLVTVSAVALKSHTLGQVSAPRRLSATLKIQELLAGKSTEVHAFQSTMHAGALMAFFGFLAALFL